MQQPDVWIFAGTHGEALHYARAHDLSPGEWLFVREDRVIRGRQFTPQTQLVYLTGYDGRSDVIEIEHAVRVMEVASAVRPTIIDRRRHVPDELLRSSEALEHWLAS